MKKTKYIYALLLHYGLDDLTDFDYLNYEGVFTVARRKENGDYVGEDLENLLIDCPFIDTWSEDCYAIKRGQLENLIAFLEQHKGLVVRDQNFEDYFKEECMYDWYSSPQMG
jgi:hypothetical protein